MRSRYTLALLAIQSLMGLGHVSSACYGEDLAYHVTDPRLQVRLIDSSEDESFLSPRTDTEGRLFVGAREALYVYEPDGEGGFAERVELYRFPEHTWIYDIAIRGDDLYITTATTVYLIPEGRVKRTDISVEPFLWGLPSGSHPNPTWGVHNGIHGLDWGPEGDLYISFGDLVWYYSDFSRPDHWGHWYFYLSDGTEIPYNGVGGVIRLRPDGTNFQVVATGLRNPCGLAFDSQWNLFTHDNDHEGQSHLYVPSRLLHVNPGCDFCWPRGWMVSKSPDRYDLLQTMYGGMGRSVPVGQSYYDEPLFPEGYRDSILLARWAHRTVVVYRKRPFGATFLAEQEVLLQCRGNARPVGVVAGTDGRIYAMVCYMNHNEASPIYRSDLVVIEPAEPAGTAPEPVNLLTLDSEDLYGLLESDSWIRRQSAHVEILRRPEVANEATARLSLKSAPAHAQRHLMHLSASDCSSESDSVLSFYAEHESDAFRLQSIRALARQEDPAFSPIFVKGLSDESLPVRLAAIEGLARLGEVPDELLAGPACSDDTYLRQAAVRVMEEHLSLDQLAELAVSPNVKLRMAAVMAIGRQLTVPRIHFVPPSEFELADPYSPQVYLDHELIDLKEKHDIGNYNVSELWHGIPHTETQERQFQLLSERMNDDFESIRLQSAFYLTLLRDERSEPAIQQVRESATTGRLAEAADQPIDKIWMVGPFDDGSEGLNREHPPEVEAVRLDANYAQEGGSLEWQQVASETGDYTETLEFEAASASYYALFEIQSANRQRLWLNLRSAGQGAVWHNGLNIWEQNQPSEGVSEDRLDLMLQPGTNTFMIRIHAQQSPAQFSVTVRALEKLIISLPQPSEDSLADRIADAIASGGETIGEEFLDVDWAAEASGGDVEHGRALFTSIGCVKCHAVSNDIPVAGAPSLADSNLRFTAEYIAESVLLPSAKVSEFFHSTTILKMNGQVVSGLVLNETPEFVELLQPDAERIKIPFNEIDERHGSELSAMPQGLVKTPEELVDLLAYLLSEES